MMKAYIITMTDSFRSNEGNERLRKSIDESKSVLDVHTSVAVVPETLVDTMESYFGGRMEYTYPVTEDQNRHDIKSGLKLTAYPTQDIRKRISCLMSHYVLWKHCVDLNEPIVILEHDAIWNHRKFDYKDIEERFKGSVLGLNSPHRATRKPQAFDDQLKSKWTESSVPEIMPCPWIDDQAVPQGLAGNSAYVIKPKGAKALMALIAEHGLWPNDAIMCKQLMPGQLQCVYPYYTYVRTMGSTTSL
jgi:GR25 family glycosyltransferase involved in LPS biosynthesis